ncbi:glycerol kinase GlpK [Pasteurella atlantica]|uniref:glycerol kinase GlpK n=1 Tax=Pasteurellaceae TaxID=712 RepID=UPI0027638022|nr:glycerol kinase GlpK [Pasteurella atlantica]MDP8033905.1 glycerol kinase GlpK [Pasteurella atlantica]MDP8035908.1 glycerol kinase GlpK [Pasteurella atlantica]MDP8037753.1 glycerol kinase GlpK [Pasteurella atlantica]MDP8048141.1 glycerol kinase GlpK [Pasteurella atlantica]MDP8050231.1 glycerol kinase GlpK [Pasteurella atlantica]
MSKYIIALDQGTTSSRAIIFNHSGEIVNVAQKEFTQHFPETGWVEHNPEAIWSTQISVMSEAITKARIKEDEIAAVGITNQRETTMIWDRKTGEPIARAIVWQDRRTARYCDTLKEEYGEVIRKKTGLVIDAYFSASKIKWLLDNVEGARERAEKGELAFGTMDSWLVWRLTEGKVHITDVTNASRTMIYNIHDMQWDEELLALFDIPKSLLPEVKSSSEIYGYVDSRYIQGGKVPIAGIAGDQQAALFGQMCTQKGMVKTTYGTGCFLLMNTGEEAVESKNNLLTTVAWQIGGKTTYALEGGVFVGGAAIQWVRDGLRTIRTADAINGLASMVEDNGGVYFVPALAGMGAPYWDQYARGTIMGITRGTTDAHIARATLEGIAFEVYDIVKAMEADSGVATKELRVDGGAAASNLLMQIQSDVFQFNVVRPQVLETTALGAAYLAGLAVGFWKDTDDISAQWQKDRVFTPELEQQKVDHMLKYWHKAVNAARHWIEE